MYEVPLWKIIFLPILDSVLAIYKTRLETKKWRVHKEISCLFQAWNNLRYKPGDILHPKDRSMFNTKEHHIKFRVFYGSSYSEFWMRKNSGILEQNWWEFKYFDFDKKFEFQGVSYDHYLFYSRSHWTHNL